MKHLTLHVLILGILLPLAAVSQTGDTPPPLIAQPVATPQATPQAAPQAMPSPLPSVASVQPVPDKPVADSVPAVASATPALGKGEFRLNFQNASLADVLNYLSEAAGFIIVQDTPVSGTINVVSKQTVTADDAIDLLNSVLVDKGYTAIRNGRILKIVSRNGAQRQDLPVMAGSDPKQIPRKDQMVNQILPVHYVDASKLVENLRPLLSPDATISANEASNALLLTDTQTNIHRIAEIINALDTSISSISAIRVFPLQYADSKSLAGVLTQLFADPNSGKNGSNGRNVNNAVPPWAAAMIGGRGRGGSQDASATQSAAQQAASRVVVVSDDQSNSIIVSAPEAAMSTITEIINRIDTNIADITETRIFRLEHADSTELSNVINSLYGDSSSMPAGGGANANRRPPTAAATTSTANRSERSLLQSRVVAVSDPRTNSLLISAARDSMSEIALLIGRLDADDTKKQKVYVHSLENADPDNVATILRGMFGGQNNSSNSGAQPASNQLNQRTLNGASSGITNLLNTSGNNSRARSR